MARESDRSHTGPEGGGKIPEELRRAVAFLFQSEGGEIEKEDFIYRQSVDLEWFSSEEARELLELAEKENLVKVKDEKVEANFDYKNVDIPIGFQPSDKIFESSGERNLFQKILGEMVAKSDLEKQEIMSKVNKKQDRLNVEIRTALLLVAQEEDIELDDREDYIEKIEMDIREG